MSSNFNSISELSIAEISNCLADQSLKCVDVTKHAIHRHNQFNSKFNAYKSWNEESAIQQAKQADEYISRGELQGVLHGIPVSVKDNYGLQGFPVYAGTPRPLPHKWCQEGPVVQSLRDGGCIFVGKTHLVEFAYGGLGTNNHWGTPRNPWDNHEFRVPGGSSSGAAVSICEGSAFVALGTDTAGSVRVPASFTGIVGLKIGAKRWSTAGIVPLSPYLDTAGILVRSVSDAIATFSVVDPETKNFDSLGKKLSKLRSKKLRLGIADGVLWNNSESSITDACLQATKALDKSRFSVVSVNFPEADKAVDLRNQGGTASAEFMEFIQSELPDWGNSLDPNVLGRTKLGGDITAVDYLARMRQIKKLSFSALNVFENCDAIICPTVPISPPKLADVSEPDQYQKTNLLALQNTCVANYLSLAAITIPVGLDSLELPVGLQLMAPASSEELLMNIAEAIEQAGLAPKLNLK